MDSFENTSVNLVQSNLLNVTRWDRQYIVTLSRDDIRGLAGTKLFLCDNNRVVTLSGFDCTAFLWLWFWLGICVVGIHTSILLRSRSEDNALEDENTLYKLLLFVVALRAYRIIQLEVSQAFNFCFTQNHKKNYYGVAGLLSFYQIPVYNLYTNVAEYFFEPSLLNVQWF